jgi:hypothetical protein
MDLRKVRKHLEWQHNTEGGVWAVFTYATLFLVL